MPTLPCTPTTVRPSLADKFSFIWPCADIFILHRYKWADPDASCTTGPETPCYWANTMHTIATAMGPWHGPMAVAMVCIVFAQ